MRTLADLATLVPEERLEQALDTAHRRRLLDPARFLSYLDRPENLARPGSGVLREMLAVRRGGRAIESELETSLFRLLLRSGLPLPTPQYEVRTRKGVRRIDFAYPDERVAIEVDGWVHDGRRAFDADQARSSELGEAGWRVLPFTWTALREASTDVVVSIGIALGLKPAKWEGR